MPETRLLIATPVDGDPENAMVAFGYAKAVAMLLSENKDAALLSPGLMGYPSDLVRARSRAARVAIEGGFTHVLWLDADTIPKRGTIGRMLELGYDWIGCPYPRKRIHWDRVRPMPHEEPEYLAYDYAYHFTNGPDESRQAVEVREGCVPVERLSIGCTLTSTRALKAVWDHFEEDDWFTDVVEGKHIHCVAIFGLLMSNVAPVQDRSFRALFSEDYSACERYNVMREARPDLGFEPIQMMVSHPADHVGWHRFHGDARGLVYAR
jgi:hypothetical protein